MKNNEKLTKIILTIVGIAITLIYCIKGGFYSLLFTIKESKVVILYTVILAILIGSLIALNIKDEPKKITKKQKDISSYITVGLLGLIVLFGILLICTLIDFLLPIIVIVVVLVLIYYLVTNLSKELIKKA